jgi:hypothetical protein
MSSFVAAYFSTARRAALLHSLRLKASASNSSESLPKLLITLKLLYKLPANRHKPMNNYEEYKVWVADAGR